MVQSVEFRSQAALLRGPRLTPSMGAARLRAWSECSHVCYSPHFDTGIITFCTGV